MVQSAKCLQDITSLGFFCRHSSTQVEQIKATSPEPKHHFTFEKCIQGLEDAPPEGGQGVLDAGAQAQDALEVWLPQQLLPVGNQVRRAAQQRRHVVHKLRHQAGVGVICLAVVVGHHLGATESEERAAARWLVETQKPVLLLPPGCSTF